MKKETFGGAKPRGSVSSQESSRASLLCPPRALHVSCFGYLKQRDITQVASTCGGGGLHASLLLCELSVSSTVCSRYCDDDSFRILVSVSEGMGYVLRLRRSNRMSAVGIRYPASSAVHAFAQTALITWGTSTAMLIRSHLKFHGCAHIATIKTPHTSC
jgi:hypothetical protein